MLTATQLGILAARTPGFNVLSLPSSIRMNPEFGAAFFDASFPVVDPARLAVATAYQDPSTVVNEAFLAKPRVGLGSVAIAGRSAFVIGNAGPGLSQQFPGIALSPEAKLASQRAQAGELARRERLITGLSGPNNSNLGLGPEAFQSPEARLELARALLRSGELTLDPMEVLRQRRRRAIAVLVALAFLRARGRFQ